MELPVGRESEMATRFHAHYLPVRALLLIVEGAQALADVSLADAVRAGDVAAVRRALAEGYGPDERSGAFTPVSLAAIRGDGETVKLLLEAGADPDRPSLLGANALSAAVRSCRADEEMVRALVDAGTDLENRSGVGITPLMLVIQERRVDMALLLMELGADVNTLNRFGEGVLNYAIYVRSPTLVRAVLDRDVDAAQLRELFTTVEYDPPGIGDARPHHEVLCD